MTEKIKSRDSNFELLRIFSMIFIILFHCVFKSYFQYSELTINTLFIKTCWFLGELGVNLFILITGYYLSKSSFSIKKIILIILEVYFYNIINYTIGYSVGHILDIPKATLLFPIASNAYWFMSAYVLIYLLSPYYNKLIKSLSKKSFQKFIFVNLLIWAVIPSILGLHFGDSESFSLYNRFIWLTFIYFVGGYIRKYNIKFFNSKKNCIILSCSTLLLMMLSIVFLYIVKVNLKLDNLEIAYLWTPNNIFMFILSISVFMLFKNINIGNNFIVNKISSATLGIYLLHDGALAIYIWYNIFKSNVFIYSKIWFIYAIGSTLAIFLIGMLIDWIRQFIEKKIIIKILDLKIWNNVYKQIEKKTLKLVRKFI